MTFGRDPKVQEEEDQKGWFRRAVRDGLRKLAPEPEPKDSDKDKD